MLGKLGDTAEITADGVRGVVAELEVFEHALGEDGLGLGERCHGSAPSV